MKKSMRLLVLSGALTLFASPLLAGTGPGGNDPPPPGTGNTTGATTVVTTSTIIAAVLSSLGL